MRLGIWLVAWWVWLPGYAQQGRNLALSIENDFRYGREVEGQRRLGVWEQKNRIQERFQDADFLYAQAAFLLRWNGQDTLALQLFRQSLQKRLAFHPFDSNAVADSYNAIGELLHYYRGQTDSAKHYFLKAKNLRGDSGSSSWEPLARTYYNLGATFQKEADWRKAQEYFELGLAHGEALPEKLRLRFYNGLATTYHDAKSFRQAIDLLNEYVLSSPALSTYEEVKALEILSFSYLGLPIPDTTAAAQSLYYAYSLMPESPGINYALFALYKELQELDSCRKYFSRRLTFNNYPSSQQAFLIYSDMATAWLQFSKPDSALELLEASIDHFLPTDFEVNSLYLWEFDELDNKAELFQYLFAFAKCYYQRFLLNGSVQDLSLARKWNDQASHLVQIFRSRIQRDASRQLNTEHTWPVVMHAIVLAQAIETTQEDLLKLYDGLRRSKAALWRERTGIQSNARNKTDVGLSRWEARSTDRVVEHFRGLDDSTTQFSTMLTSQKISSWTEVAPIEPVLDYFWGSEDVHAVLWDGNALSVHALGNSRVLARKVDSLLTMLRHPPKLASALPDALAAYQRVGKTLFEALVPVKLREDLPHSLWIVPDGPLAHLPFHALPLNEEWPSYWMEESKIGYLFSAEQLRSKPWQESTGEVLAVAYSEPFLNRSFGRRGKPLGSLPYSAVELEAIASQRPGVFWKGKEAKVENWLLEAPKYDILHLAVHGAAFPEPTLYFPTGTPHGQELTAQQISRLSLPGGLAVLSGCETGLGKTYLGEGSATLGRAFSEAGSQYVVMSLWQVNDRTTADLMQAFYGHLAQDSPSEALYAAEKYLLSETSGTIYQHPGYWAAFVGYGTTPKSAGLPNRLWLTLPALLILLIAAWGYRKI